METLLGFPILDKNGSLKIWKSWLSNFEWVRHPDSPPVPAGLADMREAWPGLPPLRIPVGLASTRPGPARLAVPICEPRSAPLVHRTAPRRPLLLLFAPSPASPSHLPPGPSRSPSHRGADLHICRSPSRAAPLSSARRRSSFGCGACFKVRPFPPCR